MNNAASPLRRILILAGYLALGVLFGLFCHYLLYRFLLPIEPFIYVSF